MNRPAPKPQHHASPLEYRLLLAACFPLFLLSACAGALFPGRERSAERRGGSLLSRARLGVAAALPFAFAG